MSTQTAPEALSDDLLEERILEAHNATITASTRSERIAAARRMAFLVGLRRPEVVARMEMERGIGR